MNLFLIIIIYSAHLQQVHNGQQVACPLRKENLGGLSKGTILLELEVIYNSVSLDKHMIVLFISYAIYIFYVSYFIFWLYNPLSRSKQASGRSRLENKSSLRTMPSFLRRYEVKILNSKILCVSF